MRKHTLVLALSIITLFIIATALASAGGLFPTVPAPARLPGNSNNTAGIYIARDNRNLDPSVYPVVGGHNTFTWEQIEVAPGTYDWSPIDGFIAAEDARGKKAAFGISTYNGRIVGGIAVPPWLISSYPNATYAGDSGSPTKLTTPVCTPDATWRIPRYWNGDYKARYQSFVTALANRYKNDPRVAWVQIGVGLYGETQPNDSDGVFKNGLYYYDDACTKAAMAADGRTDYQQFWVETVQAMVDIWAAAWGNSKPVFLVYTPTFIHPNERVEETRYAAAKYGIGLFAGGVYADQTDVFSVPPGGNPFGTGNKKWDPIVVWNASPTATIPIAFESYLYMLPDLDNFYWGILNALDKHPDFINLENDLFMNNGDPSQPRSENFDQMMFANRYLGKTITTTPSVWVALREYDESHTMFGCTNPFIYPQWGNYNFWLYQDNTAPGGATITATTTYTYTDSGICTGGAPTVKVNPRYDPLLAGHGPQGWTTRRTNGAAGQNYMYFSADQRFKTAQGITTSVAITVTYFDHITGTVDTWSLEYLNPSGITQTRTITKTNTNTWRTTTFYLTDFSFSRGFSNNDFRIYNGGDGDEYIHMVEIAKWTPYTGPTFTPTPTRTITPTPTSTPMVATFQQGFGGYIGAVDTTLSSYEPTANFASDPVLRLRSNDAKAAALRFALTGIPAGAQVLSATLTVRTTYASNPNTTDVTAYRLLRPWVDTEATWINATASTPWASPGANGLMTDRTDYGTSTQTLSTAGQTVTFDVTEWVRFWVAVPQENYGLILKAAPGGSVEYTIASSEYNTPADLRPILAVWYYPTFIGPTPTRTPTRTPTQTLTPTPTNTPTPMTALFQKGQYPTASYMGVQDTFISNLSDTMVNYGISTTINIRSGDKRAGLIRFDLSSIPHTATVVSGTLRLDVEYATNSNPITVSLYALNRPWSETEATWVQAAAGNPWFIGGANGIPQDRSGTLAATLTMTDTSVYTFDITSLVQGWVANPSTNHGLVIKATAGPDVEYAIWSSDWLNPSPRPLLQVTYYVTQMKTSLPIILRR